MSSVITVKDMCLWYGQVQALKNININIEEKSITALIGPSGCGKSTFLKSLNRMTILHTDRAPMELQAVQSLMRSWKIP